MRLLATPEMRVATQMEVVPSRLYGPLKPSIPQVAAQAAKWWLR